MRKAFIALALIAATPAQAQFAASLIFRTGADTMFVGPGEVEATAVLLADGGMAVDIAMSGKHRFDFSVLTANHVGDPMTVILCNVALLRPTVTERIESGRVTIRAPNLAAAEALAAVINGKLGCAGMPQ